MKIASIFFFLSVFSLWGYKLPKGIDPSRQNEIEAALNELAEPDESVGFGQGVESERDTLRIPIDDIHWLAGRWEFSNSHSDFEIDLSAVGTDSIRGKVCCVTQQGNRIDCADQDNVFGILKDGKVEAAFYSAYGTGKLTGKAIIYRTSDDEIVWHVTKTPEGGSEILETVILEKEAIPDE